MNKHTTYAADPPPGLRQASASSEPDQRNDATHEHSLHGLEEIVDPGPIFSS